MQISHKNLSKVRILPPVPHLRHLPLVLPVLPAGGSLPNMAQSPWQNQFPVRCHRGNSYKDGLYRPKAPANHHLSRRGVPAADCRVDFSRTNRDASRKSHRFPQTEPASRTMPDRRSRPASAETHSRTPAKDNAYSHRPSAFEARRRSHTGPSASCGWPDPHAPPPDAQGRDTSS